MPPPRQSPAPSVRGDRPTRRSLALLLVLVAAGQAFTWARLEGYQLADCVEYLDRAHHVATGGTLDPSTARSFAFSLLFVPVVWICERLPIDAPGLPMALARAMQLAFGLTAVALTVRVTARRFGAGAGLAAGALLGLNPIFLRYSVAPLSGTAAMLAVLLALDRLERTRTDESRGGFAPGLVVGAWLGIAVWMAYQNLLVVFALVPCLVFARRWRAPLHVVGVLAGILTAYALQGVLDLRTYGQFGSSIHLYMRANIASQLGSILVQFGLKDAGLWIYDTFGTFEALEQEARSEGVSAMRSMTTKTWYVEQLTKQLMAPAGVALVLLGAAGVAARRDPLRLLLLVVLLANIGVMSVKGSKSFRLWLPFLPFLAILGGAGVGAVLGGAWRRGRGPLLRGALALGLLLLALGGGLRLLLAANLFAFGSYWRGMEVVNAEVSERGGTAVASSGYDWAVRYRQSPDVTLRKLPHHLDRWAGLEADERVEVLAAFADLDFLIAHLQLLNQDPAIVEAANAHFEIAAILHDYEHAEDMLPVFVLRRRTGSPDAWTFYEVFRDTGPGEPNEPGAYQARIQHPVSVDFRRRVEDGVRQMVFLGFDVEPGPIDGTQAWVTYHWYAGPTGGVDYTVVDRFTDGRGGGETGNAEPAWGAYPTSRWREGEIVRSSFFTRFHPEPAHFGGPYRRGDLLPVQLWLAIAEFDEEGRSVGGLNPFRPSGAAPVHKEKQGTRTVSNDGRRFTSDGLMLVAGFSFPVPAAWSLPDDGRPVAEAPGAP